MGLTHSQYHQVRLIGNAPWQIKTSSPFGGLRNHLPLWLAATMPRTQTQNFRQRYDALEQRREELIARLAALGANAHANPAHGRARTLLNQTFRKASLVQRAAVLEAADWLITVLDKASMLM